MKVMSVHDIQKLIKIIGLKVFLVRLITFLENDFSRWDTFRKSVRHATYFAQGAIELMPCANDQFYTFKYVNRHPANTAQGKLSIIGIGQLSDTATGYPLLLSEMTLLTALRTAATGALAAKYLARENSQSLAIIGTGAQSEFQVIAFSSLFPLQQIRYFDIDAAAMAKFSRNLAPYAFELIPCANIRDAIRNSDIVITATASNRRQTLFELQDVTPGTHIYAMGGDCPGKTELSRTLLQAAKIVVEFIPQTLKEGEVQQCDASDIYAELWELVTKRKRGRENATEITVFDSVGFALEDFATLRLVYELALEYQLGSEIALLPEVRDPKDLFSVLSPFPQGKRN
ncbi:ornithine cyclodeaminase [Nitrosomonas sp. Nm33]|uniref:ornithine cyclodeaminase n=1 Tax=Nitrosomonas sp. Nm33 TaxID=133724 RepID=UPI0008959A11|nr:ornithine cyclodeaminase [Nitrosomonas sp. Nm33]SDZ04677.1 ornithine cyclodeaminase [Nitrosomonas sp. Nm33]